MSTFSFFKCELTGTFANLMARRPSTRSDNRLSRRRLPAEGMRDGICTTYIACWQPARPPCPNVGRDAEMKPRTSRYQRRPLRGPRE
jgi:hypothetical protein